MDQYLQSLHLGPVHGLCILAPITCSSVSSSFAALLWPSWPLGLPTASSLTLFWSCLANAPILLGQASLHRAERELYQIGGREGGRGMGYGGGECGQM